MLLAVFLYSPDDSLAGAIVCFVKLEKNNKIALKRDSSSIPFDVFVDSLDFTRLRLDNLRSISNLSRFSFSYPFRALPLTLSLFLSLSLNSVQLNFIAHVCGDGMHSRIWRNDDTKLVPLT